MAQNKVLLIEDNPLLTDMYTAALTAADFKVLIAHNGAKGIGMAQQECPDVIMLDVLMPGASGVEILPQLRAHEATAHTKIIALTSLKKNDVMEHMQEEGVDDFIIKSSVSLEELVDRVKGVLAT